VLHRAGAHVTVTARRAGRLEDLAQECGSRIETLAGDIADPRHRQAVADLVRPYDRLDVLVNNAGVCADGSLEQELIGPAAPGLFDPDPAEQVLPADRVQEGRMVAGHVPPDHPDNLVIAVASGHEPALASD